MKGPWNISFNPKWGGPKDVVFEKLEDWRINTLEGIKYYSGIAIYHNTLEIPANLLSDKKTDLFLDLGEVANMARIRINGKDLGVVWAAPFQVKISDVVVPGINQVDIDVANLWPNRLIGDEQFPDDGVKNNQWPEWMQKKQPRTSGRYTFTTLKYYKKDSELLKSGLLGPVQLLKKTK